MVQSSKQSVCRLLSLPDTTMVLKIILNNDSCLGNVSFTFTSQDFKNMQFQSDIPTVKKTVAPCQAA